MEDRTTLIAKSGKVETVLSYCASDLARATGALTSYMTPKSKIDRERLTEDLVAARVAVDIALARLHGANWKRYRDLHEYTLAVRFRELMGGER